VLKLRKKAEGKDEKFASQLFFLSFYGIAFGISNFWLNFGRHSS
jgi:hypothetical protein